MSEPETGDGTTTITWTDSSSEESESYAIYSSGEFSINDHFWGRSVRRGQ